MAGLGWQELVIVLVIIMIIFGAGKLPEVVKSLGQGVKEFKAEANASTDSLAAATSTGSTESFDAAAPTADRARVRADEI
jgi:sec-independent protein translocase protein TatA